MSLLSTLPFGVNKTRKLPLTCTPCGLHQPQPVLMGFPAPLLLLHQCSPLLWSTKFFAKQIMSGHQANKW